MTLVIAAQGAEFVVLGADSRGTLTEAGGSRVELNIFQKLRQVNDHVAVMMYGDMDAARYLVNKFRETKGSTPTGVTKVAEEFAELCRAQFRAIPPVASTNVPFFGYVIAGLDERDDKYVVPGCFGMMSQDGFWLRSYEKFAIEGKPLIANYLFANEYKDSMSVDELSRLVARAFHDTVNIDGDVGGRITLAIIASDGTRVLPPEDLEVLIEEKPG